MPPGFMKIPVGRQIATALRSAILSRQIPSRAKVPSTRALAEELGVSRNTVLEAYSQLLSEGFLETRSGSGTFVSGQIGTRRVPAQRSGEDAEVRLSARGRRIAGAFASVSDDISRPFSPGLP